VYLPNENGIVQEYRKTVQKIAPLAFGDLQLIIAGSGNADLIDAFTLVISRQFSREKSPETIQRAHSVIERQLKKFYRDDISVADNKDFKVFIAAFCLKTRQHLICHLICHRVSEDVEVMVTPNVSDQRKRTQSPAPTAPLPGRPVP
jgi:hypothetical protein